MALSLADSDDDSGFDSGAVGNSTEESSTGISRFVMPHTSQLW